MEHADYQSYLVLRFYNILILSALIEGLQKEFTVKPGQMLNYCKSIYYKIKGLYTCKPLFKFTGQLPTAAKGCSEELPSPQGLLKRTLRDVCGKLRLMTAD